MKPKLNKITETLESFHKILQWAEYKAPEEFKADFNQDYAKEMLEQAYEDLDAINDVFPTCDNCGSINTHLVSKGATGYCSGTGQEQEYDDQYECKDCENIFPV